MVYESSPILEAIRRLLKWSMQCFISSCILYKRSINISRTDEEPRWIRKKRTCILSSVGSKEFLQSSQGEKAKPNLWVEILHRYLLLR